MAAVPMGSSCFGSYFGRGGILPEEKEERIMAAMGQNSGGLYAMGGCPEGIGAECKKKISQTVKKQ